MYTISRKVLKGVTHVKINTILSLHFEYVNVDIFVISEMFLKYIFQGKMFYELFILLIYPLELHHMTLFNQN